MTTKVVCNGSLTDVPEERPQVVGLPTLPDGDTGKLEGHTSVTGPLKVLSGTICNWYVANPPCKIVVVSKTLSGGTLTQEVLVDVTQTIWKSSAIPVTAVASGVIAPV